MLLIALFNFVFPFLFERIVRFRGALLLIALLNWSCFWSSLFLERVTKHLFLLEDFLPFLRVPQEMVVKQTLVLLPLHVSHMPR